MKKSNHIDPKASIGHIHLKVSNLERAVKFYTEVLGFHVTTKLGNNAAFLAAGGYHHHIGLNTWESENGKPSPVGSTGLYHFAILVSSRKELAKVLKRLVDSKWHLDGTADHGTHEALYLRDPDENGIEIYWDRPKNKWPMDAKGNVIMSSKALDVNSLIKELD